MGIFAHGAAAHSGFRDEWIRGSYHEPHAVIENGGAAMNYNAAEGAYDRVPLDGTYIKVFAYRPGAEKKIGEHVFILERPAEVKLHTIGYQKFPVDTAIFDSDGNKLCSVRTADGKTEDAVILLRPGRYVLRHRTIAVNYKYDAGIEFKLTKEDVPNNISQVAYHRWDAPAMTAGVPVYDYIPFSYDGSTPYRYYALYMPYDGIVTVAAEKIAGRCVIDFALVDSDENVISSWRGVYDVHEERKFDLPAG